MTTIRLHGILGKEYSDVFSLKIGNPSSVFSAIDCNRKGFLKRVVELQKQGFIYDVIVNKTRIADGYQMDTMRNPETIDLVPGIVGSGPIGAFLFGGTSILGSLAGSLALAGISYALSPKPDTQDQRVSATAEASRSSFVFGNVINTASQGTPVPIGYGRLKIGSSVIQSSIKSFPVIKPDSEALQSDNFINKVTNRDESFSAISFNN